MSPRQRSTSPASVSDPTEKSTTVRRLWTKDEDEALIKAVQRYGSSRGPGSAWSTISKEVGPNRTNKDCRKRWFHSLDPALKKGKWSEEEDKALCQLYRDLGPRWKEIALCIPGRKDDQVSKRWRDVLSPELTPKKNWEPLEDALLLQLFDTHGPKWTIIADALPGRSPIACRNRSRKYHNLSHMSGRHMPSVGSDRCTENDEHCSARYNGQPDTNPQQATSTSGDQSSMSSCASDIWPLHGNVIGASSYNQAPFDYNWEQSVPDQKDTGTTTCPATSTETSNPMGQAQGHSYLQSESSSTDLHLKSLTTPGESMRLPTPSPSATSLDTWLATLVNNTEAPSTSTDIAALWSNPQLHVPPPVDKLWTLLLALESGQSSILVSSKLLRKLMADAATGNGAEE